MGFNSGFKGLIFFYSVYLPFCSRLHVSVFLTFSSSILVPFYSGFSPFTTSSFCGYVSLPSAHWSFSFTTCQVFGIKKHKHCAEAVAFCIILRKDSYNDSVSEVAVPRRGSAKMYMSLATQQCSFYLLTRDSTLLISQANHRTCQALCDTRWTVWSLGWHWGHVAGDEPGSTASVQYSFWKLQKCSKSLQFFSLCFRVNFE